MVEIFHLLLLRLREWYGEAKINERKSGIMGITSFSLPAARNKAALRFLRTRSTVYLFDKCAGMSELQKLFEIHNREKVSCSNDEIGIGRAP